MDLEDLNWLRFTVTCPKCGRKKDVHLTVYEQRHRNGEFSIVTNRFTKCSNFNCQYDNYR